MTTARKPVISAIPHARPPIERMLRIHQALQAGNYPNAAKLAREIEVSDKTIYRDVEFMRDRLNLPVNFDPHRNGFYYEGEVGNFPTMQISEGELFALVVAEKALQQYRGTNFEKPLLSAIRKMERALPDTISVNLAELGQTISFRTRAEPILNLEIFQVLAKGAAERRQLELEYRKPGQKPEVRNGGSVSFGQHQWRMVSLCLRPGAQGHPHIRAGAHPIGALYRQDFRPPAKIFAGEKVEGQLWGSLR